MKDPDWNKIKVATTFDGRYHYRKKGFQCERCLTHDVYNDCFFTMQQEGCPPIKPCTHCKRMKRGCHEPSKHASRSPELGGKEHNDEKSHTQSDSKSVLSLLQQQSKDKTSAKLQRDTNTTSARSGPTLGKRKARPPELTTMDYVSSPSHHDSDSNSEYVITPPSVSTSSRIDSKKLAPRTSSIAEKIVVRHIPIPSAFQLSSSSSSFAHARTRHHEIHPERENPIPSSIQPSSSSTSYNIRTNPGMRPSSSTSLAPAHTNPPPETQRQAHADTAVRQMEHVNATIVALYEALEGEIREADEADRTRRARIYRIENAMKMVNRDVRAADNALSTLNANGPISVEDHARLDPELDRYRQTLAMLQDRRVLRDRAAQERQRREKEHRDFLDDELLGRLGKR